MPSGGPSVCVIGAGALGLSAGLALRRRGARSVTIIDAGHVASGSSGLSVGIVETQYVEPLDVQLRVAAKRLFETLCELSDLELVRNGYLRLGHSSTATAQFEASVALQRELGVEDAQVLSRAEVAALIPQMRVDDVESGLYGPSDGFLDGHLYCALLSELALEAGAALRLRHRVRELEVVPGGGHRVVTERATFECDVVVNAAGPWASRVAALSDHSLPLRPTRHEAVIVHLARDLGYMVPCVMDYTPHSGESGLYFRHERPGQLVAGIHTEEALSADIVDDPDEYARSAGPDFLEDVADKISSRLPALDDAALAHGWAGLYPVSPDGRPLVGPMPADESYMAAAGAGGSGIQLSPIIGELVADWVMDRSPTSLPEAETLRPGRAITANLTETA